MSQTSFGDHPSDYSTTAAKLSEQGLTRGFPKQFQYPEILSHQTYSSVENADIHINGDVGVPQARYESEPIVGTNFFSDPYQKMVLDVPFDTKYDDKINKLLLLFGLSAASLGGFLL